MMNRRVNPPWADLPQELLSTIVNLLTSNPIDILTFRAICKSWNSSSPPLSDLPPFNLSHMLPLTCSLEPLFKFDRRFNAAIPGLPIISVTAIFALRQNPFSNTEEEKECWVMFVDQLTPGKLMIRQPLTKYQYSMPLNFPSGVDVTNIHVDEIARFYNLSFHPEMNRPPSIWSQHVQKVVVNSDESRVFALLHTGKVVSSRLFIDPSSYTAGWDSFLPFGFNNDGGLINDIIYHETKLLGVDHVGRLFVRDFSSPTGKILASPIAGTCTKRKRLVESNGLVYLVVREGANRALRFKIFELDGDLNECVEVSSIGDMVFFFGLDFSFSISTQNLGGSFRKNCIVFIENSFRDYDEGVIDDVMLFSNLRFGDLRVGVWHMEDPYHCGTIGSYPDYSNVLWPPPPWLWRIDMSKRIGDLEAALDHLLVNAPAEILKLKVTSKHKPPLEQAIVVGDDSNEQDVSEIWEAAHILQEYLIEAKEIHKCLKSIKSENAFISREMKLNAILLHLEETTTKLQKVRPKNIPRRSIRVRKSTRDDAFTYR